MYKQGWFYYTIDELGANNVWLIPAILQESKPS